MIKFLSVWMLLLSLMLIPAAVTGCKAETNDDGAEIELGDPD